MGNQHTRQNLGLGDDHAVMLTFRCTKSQRRKLNAMARAARMDRSAYMRQQLGLDGTNETPETEQPSTAQGASSPVK